MKKYIAPEMKALAFEVEENINAAVNPASEGGQVYNDVDGSKLTW